MYITPGSHNTEESLNRQINDKERVAAAIENPSLHILFNYSIRTILIIIKVIEKCIVDTDFPDVDALVNEYHKSQSL